MKKTTGKRTRRSLRDIGIHDDHVVGSVIGKKNQYSPFLQCFWAIHLDLETGVEEILIGTTTLQALGLKLPHSEPQVTYNISKKT